MPHVIVKLYAGRSEPQKARLAEEITRTVIKTLGQSDRSVSVSIEDVDPMDWPQKVYRPEILDKPTQLYKRPGYNPFK